MKNGEPLEIRSLDREGDNRTNSIHVGTFTIDRIQFTYSFVGFFNDYFISILGTSQLNIIRKTNSRANRSPWGKFCLGLNSEKKQSRWLHRIDLQHLSLNVFFLIVACVSNFFQKWLEGKKVEIPVASICCNARAAAAFPSSFGVSSWISSRKRSAWWYSPSQQLLNIFHHNSMNKR